nr:MAG TPA: hypothetical protein [Caudoviricetes sp.]
MEETPVQIRAPASRPTGRLSHAVSQKAKSDR